MIRKVALVTGASSGIGKATATRLAAIGFRTFGAARSELHDAGVEPVHLDVRDPDSIHAAVATVLDRAGRMDLLVNSAGVAMISAAEETSGEEVRALFETNVFGVMQMTQAVLPAMRTQRSGRIINISSVLGFLPAPFMSTYAATKHAVAGYSESLDHEVRRFGVRVISVEPGFTRTNLGHGSAVAQQLVDEYNGDREQVIHRISESIARGVDPSVVAEVVARAATTRRPGLHYQAGRGARLLRILRSFAPPSIVDKGVRKEFGLGAAS